MKDLFSIQAEGYAKYRPVYPPELFACICALVPEKKQAWDCGTGNGQSAGMLSSFFEKVYATDISKKQIDNAEQAANIIYAVEPAEHVSLGDNSTDLVTISQALHWFDHAAFYKEVHRVSKPGAVIAAWTYNLLKIDPVTDALINHFYFETIHAYWDNERRHVDDGYANIPFPFRKLNTPDFFIKVNWDTPMLEGYLNTWSAVQKFISTNEYNPVSALMEKIKLQWPVKEQRPVLFPLKLIIGYVF